MLQTVYALIYNVLWTHKAANIRSEMFLQATML